MKTKKNVDATAKMAIAAETNKTDPQLKELLMLIYEEGEAYPGFFTDELDLDSNQINDMLKTLCQEGYITCDTYTTPARKVKYIEPVITCKGKTLLEK